MCTPVRSSVTLSGNRCVNTECNEGALQTFLHRTHGREFVTEVWLFGRVGLSSGAVEGVEAAINVMGTVEPDDTKKLHVEWSNDLDDGVSVMDTMERRSGAMLSDLCCGDSARRYR